MTKESSTGDNLVLVLFLSFLLSLNMYNLISEGVTSTLSFTFNIMCSWGTSLMLISSLMNYSWSSFVLHHIMIVKSWALSGYTSILELLSRHWWWIILALRLTANVVIGHIFMGLFCSYFKDISTSILLALFLMFEFVIYVVQSIIYSLLMSYFF